MRHEERSAGMFGAFQRRIGRQGLLRLRQRAEDRQQETLPRSDRRP
ncbi:MAG: hypothetical protein M0C28_37125 [Candidatus Moduliflexus flocculans]|nr:hypothetical protein [Candidatus Moduliflexus flocculans]